MDNLALARIHCDGMRELIANNPAHWKDEQALELIRALCERAREVISDRASRAHLSAIDDYAAALCWDTEGRGSPPRVSGPVALRREILRELRLLSVRLAELEADRGLALAEAPQPGARRRERYAAVHREAAQTVGGTARLAALLEVPLADLQRWISGAEAAPLKTFLAALDLVARGSFERDPHPVRIAALRDERQAAVAAVRRSAATSTESELPWWLGAPFGYTAPAIALLCAGALTLYLSYSTPPDIPLEPARSQAVAVQYAATEPPKIAVKKTAARKLAAAKRPVVQPKLVPVTEVVAAAEPPIEDACVAAVGFSWLLCQKQARGEYCAGREGLEPGCPSVIPASSLY